MSVKKERVNWIDIAKGIGILLVVFGHTGVSGIATILIYSFHMPLFFFLSGYLSNSKKYSYIGSFVKNKARSLLIPYFYFSIITYSYYLLVKVVSNDLDFTVIKPFIGIFYSIGIDGWMDHSIALWFLTCLFLTEIIFYFILKITEKKQYILIVLLMSSIIGYFFSLFDFIRMPWGIEIAFTAVVFFGMGYIFKNSLFTFKGIKNYIILIIFISINIYFVVQMFEMNYMIDLNYIELNNYYNFYIPALSGITIILIIAKLISKQKILSFLGGNTLIILALHLPILSTLSWIIKKVNLSFILEYQELSGMLLTILAILILVPIINFINKFIPFILGKKLEKSI